MISTKSTQPPLLSAFVLPPHSWCRHPLCMAMAPYKMLQFLAYYFQGDLDRMWPFSSELRQKLSPRWGRPPRTITGRARWRRLWPTMMTASMWWRCRRTAPCSSRARRTRRRGCGAREQMTRSASESSSERRKEQRSGKVVFNHPTIISCRGHSSYINAVAVLETYVVTGSADCTIRRWDMATCECLFVYEGHTARIQKWTDHRQKSWNFNDFISGFPICFSGSSWLATSYSRRPTTRQSRHGCLTRQQLDQDKRPSHASGTLHVQCRIELFQYVCPLHTHNISNFNCPPQHFILKGRLIASYLTIASHHDTTDVTLI